MNMQNNKSEKKSENLIDVIRFRFAPYWPLFILLVVLFELGAWFYLKTVTPIYSASASIIIKDEKKGTDDSKLLESLNISSSKKIVENEVEVIQSKDLMKKVVTKLALYAPVYEKQSFKDVIAYTTSPVLIEAQDPENIKEKNNINFSFSSATNLVEIENKTYPINKWVQTPFGVLKFSKNANLQEESKNQLYFSLNNPQRVAAGFVQNLSIAPSSKLSTVLELTFNDQSAQRAQVTLNELINAYKKWTIDEKNSVAANAVSFIEDRLKNVEKDLDSIERNLQSYKAQKGIVDLSEQGKQYLENVGQNDRTVGDISMQLAILNQAERYVQSKGERGGMVPSTLGLNDPGLTQLLQRLYDTELQYERMKKTMAENNPAVLGLQEEIDRIRPAIMENIRNQQNSLQASRRDLNATSGMYTSLLKTIPQKERVLLDMSRQQSIKSGVYSFLLQKREEAALSTSSIVADSRIIDTASSNFLPISPKRSQIYIEALLLAMIIGFIIVAGRDFFSNKILFRTEIESFTTLPIAAEITRVKHKGELVVDDPEKIAVAEQFRQLRSAIGLYSRVKKQKLLITSSIAGEGKSFTAANLALSLAISGKKVVIVDFDLRSPKTTAIFGLQREKGVAEYLEGKVDMENIIKTSRHANLFVVPAGRPDKNPTELLLDNKLAEIFTYLEGCFDYLLIDTSPVDAVIDAYILSEYCDKTLYMIRHGYTPKAMVQLLDKNNKLKALKNLAIVFNCISPRGFVKNTYGYGYGYGYNNVYTSKYKQAGQ